MFITGDMTFKSEPYFYEPTYVLLNENTFSIKIDPYGKVGDLFRFISKNNKNT